MKAEKFIKNEAKYILRNGNWVKSVTAIILLCLVPLMGVFVAEVSYALASPDGDFSTEALAASPLLIIFFVLFQLIAVVAIVLLSPLVNGCVRLFGSMANREKAEFSDIFYFFETKVRYVSAVKFMLGILVRGIAFVIASLIPAAFVYGISNRVYEDKFAVSDDLGFVYVLNAIAVVLLVVGVVTIICILLRYLFAIALFSYHDCDEKQSMRVGSQVAKKHTKALIRLTVSFIPWILLLFFVVPFLYVFPYMACSYAVSIKYLFNSYGLQLDENTEVGSVNECVSNNNFTDEQNNTMVGESSSVMSAEESVVSDQTSYSGVKSYNNANGENTADFLSDNKSAAESDSMPIGNSKTDNEFGGDF